MPQASVAVLADQATTLPLEAAKSILPVALEPQALVAGPILRFL